MDSICCVIARTSWNPVLSPDMCWKYASFSTWTDRLFTPASFRMAVTYELEGVQSQTDQKCLFMLQHWRKLLRSVNTLTDHYLTWICWYFLGYQKISCYQAGFIPIDGSACCQLIWSCYVQRHRPCNKTSVCESILTCCMILCSTTSDMIWRWMVPAITLAECLQKWGSLYDKSPSIFSIWKNKKLTWGKLVLNCVLASGVIQI